MKETALVPMCRCCLATNSPLQVSTIDGGNNQYIPNINKMNYCFPDLKFDDCGGFSLCQKCQDALNGAYDFRQNACKANVVYNAYLNRIRTMKQSAEKANSQIPSTIPKSVVVPASQDNVDILIKVEPVDKTNEIKLESSIDTYENEIKTETADETESETDGDDDDDDDDQKATNGLGPTVDSIVDARANGLDADVRHFVKSYQCKYCNKSFTHGGDFKRHVNIHTQHRPYRCTQCTKTFIQKSGLQIHLRRHTGEKPYKCDHCDKHFAHKQGLRIHKHLHASGDTQIKCGHCNKTFVYGASLQLHMRIHTGEGLRRCDFCGRTFTQSSSLERHVRTHTGEKPYKCAHCDKAFCRNFDLKRHALTHTGERLYPCERCGKTFACKDNLLKHARIHTGDQPFPCLNCGRAFRCKPELLRHRCCAADEDA